MKNRSATSIRNGRISIFLFHSNAFYGRSSSCKFLALSFITVFLFSGQFLLFFTEFLIIKLLTTIGHWVTQLNPHKLTCSCSAENLMYNYKKRDQLAQAFSWIRPPKNTKATKQRQHQRVQVLPLNLKATSTNYTLTKFFLLSAWFRDAISSLRFVFIFISPIDPI